MAQDSSLSFLAAPQQLPNGNSTARPPVMDIAQTVMDQLRGDETDLVSVEHLWEAMKRIFTVMLGSEAVEGAITEIRQKEAGAGIRKIRSLVAQLRSRLSPTAPENREVNFQLLNAAFNLACDLDDKLFGMPWDSQQRASVIVQLIKREALSGTAASTKAVGAQGQEVQPKEQDPWQAEFRLLQAGEELHLRGSNEEARIRFEAPITIEIGNGTLLTLRRSRMPARLELVFSEGDEENIICESDGRFYTARLGMDMAAVTGEGVELTHCSIAQKNKFLQGRGIVTEVIIRNHSAGGTKIRLQTTTDVYRQRLQENPNDVVTMWNLSRFYMGNGQYQNAYSILAAIAGNATHRAFLLSKVTGISFLESALRECADEIDIHENFEKASQLAQIYLDLNLLSAAEELYLKIWSRHASALNSQPKERLLDKMTTLYHRSGRYKEGYAFLAGLLEEEGLAPVEKLYQNLHLLLHCWWNKEEVPHILLKRGNLYLKQGKYQEAGSYYEQSMSACEGGRFHDEFIGAVFGMGDVWIKRNDPEKAKEYYGKALMRYYSTISQRQQDLLKSANLILLERPLEIPSGTPSAPTAIPTIESAELVGSEIGLHMGDIVLMDQGGRWVGIQILERGVGSIRIRDIASGDIREEATSRFRNKPMRRLKGIPPFQRITPHQIIRNRLANSSVTVPDLIQGGWVTVKPLGGVDQLNRQELIVTEKGIVYVFDGKGLQRIDQKGTLSPSAPHLRSAYRIIPMFNLSEIKETEMSRDALYVDTAANVVKLEKLPSGICLEQSLDRITATSASTRGSSIEGTKARYRRLSFMPDVFEPSQRQAAKKVKTALMQAGQWQRYLVSLQKGYFSAEDESLLELIIGFAVEERTGSLFLPSHSLERLAFFQKFTHLINSSDDQASEEVVLEAL